ncbi:hypothetical protein AcV5_009622 [Taiwanofungus camphoratus]|nr:hypothetical protein AcV5_009622 [Antrodia cinnamomea]
MSMSHALSASRVGGMRCRRTPSGSRGPFCYETYLTRNTPGLRTPQLRSFSAVRPFPGPSPPSPHRRALFRPPKSARPASSLAPVPPGSAQEEHLNRLFPPLQFPPELAARILTHGSHPDAAQRHNARLSFIGRRVLQSYLLLFLHASPALRPAHAYDLVAARALNTYVLGEHVAPRWSLGTVVKWSPARPAPLAAAAGRGARMSEEQEQEHAGILARLGRDTSRSVGLFKVQGTTVEAVVGGVFHQFGGSVAHRLFHTRVLPHILLPGSPDGLHDAFHESALAICSQMGGLDGALVVPQE